MPDSEVLETVKDYAFLRTDLNGWIETSTNGAQLWVDVERPAPETSQPGE
jgi:hypothetical protein